MSIPKPVAVGAVGAAVVLTATAVITHQGLNVVEGRALPETGTLTLPVGDGEQSVQVPVLPGWGYVPVGDTTGDVVYPSDRGILLHPGLRERGYVPTVIVTVDRLSDPQQTGGSYARSLSEKLSGMARSVEDFPDEVCGRPAYRIEFTGLRGGDSPGQTQSGMGITVIPENESFAYIAILQTRNPDNSSYLQQRDALLSGFCIGN
jgi:hypothetical protein